MSDFAVVPRLALLAGTLVEFSASPLWVYSDGMSQVPPVVLTIAGFDPSSGAGVTADIKTIAAHECYGVSCITALTVQSTTGVRRVHTVEPKIVLETLQELVRDLDVAAVHLGMLGTEGVVRAIAKFLREEQPPHVVLDPILRSTSGAELLDSKGKTLLLKELLPMAEVATPNLAEAADLTGLPVSNLQEMRDAAGRLHELGAVNVVVTGGGDLEKAVDLLSFRGSRGIEQETFKADRHKSNSTHGTGCAFATALACHLAMERGLPEAVLLSKAYVSAAIANAQPLGRGLGPLHHLYRMREQRRPNPAVHEPDTAHSRN